MMVVVVVVRSCMLLLPRLFVVVVVVVDTITTRTPSSSSSSIVFISVVRCQFHLELDRNHGTSSIIILLSRNRQDLRIAGPGCLSSILLRHELDKSITTIVVVVTSNETALLDGTNVGKVIFQMMAFDTTSNIVVVTISRRKETNKDGVGRRFLVLLVVVLAAHSSY
jgi:hypothetical protein